MNLQNLKELIERIEEDHEGDDDFDLSAVEVRFATQPNWPFEYSVVMPDELELFEIPEDGRMYDRLTHAVYLAENAQLGYLRGDVKSSVWH